MKLFNYIIEVNTNSKHKWSHFKIHKHRTNRHFGPVMYRHLVWGPLSIIFGQPHLIPVLVCDHCNEEIQRVGEDYLDWCEGCQSIEAGSHEITTEEYERIWG